MDDTQKSLRRLGSHDGVAGYNALTLLRTILHNIITHPQESKYLTISGKSAKFREAVALENFYSVFIQLGFVRSVYMFEEKWVLEHVSTRHLAKLRDIVISLDELIERYKPPEVRPASDNSFWSIQQQQKQQKEYWSQLSKQAEEDRIEKLEREKRTIDTLKKLHAKQKAKEDEAKLSFRKKFDLLSKPPQYGVTTASSSHGENHLVTYTSTSSESSISGCDDE
jgi:hypothetical protein